MQLEKNFLLSGKLKVNADGTVILEIGGGYPLADSSIAKVKVEVALDSVGALADQSINGVLVSLFAQAFNRAV